MAADTTPFKKSILPDPVYTADPRPGDTVLAAEDILADLNAPQRDAVTHGAGPLLVVAGAGTGKTRVITRRIAWLVTRGVLPRSILAITFTNKAADVLKERLAALPGGRDVVAGTFHAFGASLLRRYADRIGGSKDFTILDTDDQERLIRDLLSDLGLASPSVRPAAVADAISRRKNGAREGVPAASGMPDFEAIVSMVEPAYAARLEAAALYDFDDLILEPARLLREAPAVRDEVRARFRHVLVDEYQDTNAAQLDLLKEVVNEERNLCVTGDPDQSIYRWRGATVRNILEFEKDFPGARRVTLEDNYRSTKTILAAAERVIDSNTERHEKRLRTKNPDGTRLVEVRCDRSPNEARAVVAILKTWLEDGAGPSDLAVFYRVNHVSRGIETALTEAGVPYAVVSGVEFYERREVKDALAYARLIENPRDDAAFSRIANVPRRGVGGESLGRLRAAATARGTSLAEAAALGVDGVAGRARKGLDALLACLARLRALPRAPTAPVFEAILSETGYREDLLHREDEIERSRVENVDELVTAAREADRADPGIDLRRFLERASLASEQDGWEGRSGRVSLMTVHAAKGLEFDGVVVAGAEDGWFPHARNSAPEAVEEERRLFYVAMTRARKHLALTHVAVREGWRGPERRTPSRFLLEIPDACVDLIDHTGTYERARARREGADPAVFAGRLERRVGRVEGADDEWPDCVEEPAEEYGAAGGDLPAIDRAGGDRPAKGDRVVHRHFGEGRLLSFHGAGENLSVTVLFDRCGTKTMRWEHAEIVRAAEPPEGGPS